ncbi:MAG: ankyrin repeat domain-containing protein [bacterium]
MFLIMLAIVTVASSTASEAKTFELQTEFVRAVSRGEHDKIRALIDKGADVNEEADGFTPLMLARDPETVRLLADAGANINASSTLFKKTMLGWAASGGNADIVKALIEAGADVNAKDEIGGTALSAAVMAKPPRIDIIKILINAGADPDIGLFLDQPFLVWASMVGNVDVIKALIDAGADVNVRNKKGATPLMAAVAARQKEAVKLLIDSGADVNARSYPPKGKRKRGGKKGQTATDVAKAMGDKDIEEMLIKAGAKESDKPPVPDYKKPNAPGMYTLDCGVSGSPPPQGRKFTCSGIDQVADSGTETLVFSKAYFAGKHAVPMEKGCRVDLGQPGFYTIQTTTMATPWELVCRARLRTTTGGEKWIAFIRKGKTVIKTSEHKAVVKKPEKKAPKEKKEPPGIKIVKPVDSDQFAFNKDEPRGVLEIEAEAEVTGDCDDAATWEVEDIGESKKKFDPEDASDNVTIKFEDLPGKNSDFGKKKITARACGKSDSVTVEVFFSPEVKNHPGEGSGETSNWFYYWGQTRAGKGFNPDYIPEKIASDGSKAVGQYDYTEDKVFLTDKIMQTSCAPRVQALGGKESKGIDCFAETVRHETQHQKERWEWWGAMDPTSLNGTARRAYDADNDLVPNSIEKQLEKSKNCREWDATSCDGRPKDNLFDVEMNAYWIGWEWPVGSADKEDWSWCGKQWDDISVCPGNKQW